MSKICLQKKFAPKSICFGCGPANSKGLQIESFIEGDFLVAEWTPQPHHEAFPGVLNGGIVGALLDCHCNWAAAYKLMQAKALTEPPCTVTAEYSIKLLRPTPTKEKLFLKAHVVEVVGEKVRVEGTLSSAHKVCATCAGTFVAVGKDHPAFHRW